MAYLKPQSPIRYGEDHIYPLTTVDQIMMDDGNRLSGVGVYLEKPEESTDTTVYGNNATTLDGKLASEYALKTDTVTNSTQFNGYTFDAFKTFMLNTIYPVGAIYISTSSTSPASLFGGTWTQIKDTFLLAAGSTYSAGSTGGAAAHTLTANELPKITGTVESGSGNTGATSGGFGTFRGASGAFSVQNVRQYCPSGSNGTWPSGDTYERVNMSFGNNQPHNNMPPYLAVYMWWRVS